MKAPLFDDRARTLRRQRAARLGGDRFLHQRAFDDIVDRLADVCTPLESAIIIGESSPEWGKQLAAARPGLLIHDESPTTPASVDLCLTIGDLESVNDVQAAAFALRHLLRPGGLLLGAIVGGSSLPRLRRAMLAADRAEGGAAPHLHPSIDGPSLAALLISVGLAEPVVEVDRVSVSYANFDRLVADLRAMGCTNILAERARRPVTRRGLAAAKADFHDGAVPTVETFELLHFAAWAPQL